MSTLKSFLSSFGAAGKGIVCTIREERNFRFHLTAAFYVFCLRGFYGEYFSLSRAEDAVLFLTIGAVFAMELLNTAVENAVDLCSPQLHPLAGKAKDAAAAAVLVSAAAAVCIGVCLFWQPEALMLVAVDLLTHPFKLAALFFTAILSVFFIFKSGKS